MSKLTHNFYFCQASLKNRPVSSKKDCTREGLEKSWSCNRKNGRDDRDFDSVSDFFSGAASGSADEFPLCETDIISGCEKELAEAQKGQDEGLKKECIMRLSWALVHSKLPGDVQRGIAMLEALVINDTSAIKLREKLYLLAVGYYRSGDFPRSRDFIEQCLEVEPESGQAQTLKRAIEDRIVRDGVIGVGIAVTAVGLVAGIAAALVRRG